MARLLPDPTLYPAMAAEAPAEQLAYVALLASGDNGKTDALGVVDLRFLVASRTRHDDHERVGHAQHGVERRESRAVTRWQVR